MPDGCKMIEEFASDDERAATFAALRERLQPGAPGQALAPGARCLLAWRDGEPVARLSWERADDLVGAAGPCGILGHYEAVDEAAGVGLLRAAVARLEAAGARRAVGPMNGSTWARYRFALPPEAGLPSPSPFLTEPQNPPDYPAHFTAAGFRVAAEYESRIVEDLASPRPGAGSLAARMAAAGIQVRPAALDRFEEELRAIYALSASAFAGSPFYRPIPFAPFRAMYNRLRPLLDSELIRLAFDRDGQLVGFLFAFPDPVDSGGRPQRVILKTFATAPLAPHPGLGTHLADQLHELAARKGYRSVIHALMHTGNNSRRISPRFRSRSFRRYALYEWVA